ncbi:MAG: MBL fold metallo-hydrolase, partial [Methanomassiliicoccales archaeon]
MLDNKPQSGETPFKLHQIEGYISTIFLVEYPYGMLLLDCGCAGDVAKIEAKCVELGRPLSDIKLAVATHAHPDHLGGAAKLRRKYAIPIAAHPEIDLWYRGAGGFIQHKVDSFFA